MENINNKQVLIGALKEGDIFGEMSFLRYGEENGISNSGW